MNAEIQTYLSSAKPDFDSGFALLCKYGRNRTVVDWVARRHDMPKLIYELRKLASATVSTTAPPPPEAHLASVPKVAPSVPKMAPSVPKEPSSVPDDVRRLTFRTFDDRRNRRSDLPPHLQEVFDRNAQDYKIRRAFHEKMKMAVTDKDRAIFRAKVLETHERIREGWAQIDDYWTAAAEQKTKEADFNESTFRSYLSKALRRERNSPEQVATCKARLRALLEHGCNIDEKTIRALADKGLA